jgi:hypothetical protein
MLGQNQTVLKPETIDGAAKSVALLEIQLGNFLKGNGIV